MMSVSCSSHPHLPRGSCPSHKLESPHSQSHGRSHLLLLCSRGLLYHCNTLHCHYSPNSSPAQEHMDVCSDVCCMIGRCLKIQSRNVHRYMAHILTYNDTCIPNHKSLYKIPMSPSYPSSNEQGNSSGCKILSQLRSLRLQVHHEEAQLLTLNETWCPNHMSWNMNPMHPNSSSSHQLKIIIFMSSFNNQDCFLTRAVLQVARF